MVNAWYASGFAVGKRAARTRQVTAIRDSREADYRRDSKLAPLLGRLKPPDTEDLWIVPSYEMPIRKPRTQASVQKRRVLP